MSATKKILLCASNATRQAILNAVVSKYGHGVKVVATLKKKADLLRKVSRSCGASSATSSGTSNVRPSDGQQK